LYVASSAVSCHAAAMTDQMPQQVVAAQGLDVAMKIKVSA
jgi:hypothetical protein